RDKAPLAQGERKDTPENLWERCSNCSEIIFKKDFIANQNVCPKCQFHYPVDPYDRISRFLDPDGIDELDANLSSPDPLAFVDKRPYHERLHETQARLKRLDAIICVRGFLMGRPVQMGVFDFEFMGGSMGSVVGEKIARLYRRAVKNREPAIIVTSS